MLMRAGARMKIKNGEETVEGEPQEFTVAGDSWQEITVADGAVLKIKLVVTDVVKTKKINPETGEPYYWVRSIPVLSRKIPQHEKKGEAGGHEK